MSVMGNDGRSWLCHSSELDTFRAPLGGGWISVLWNYDSELEGCSEGGTDTFARLEQMR
jgi:hypothetical protein